MGEPKRFDLNQNIMSAEGAVMGVALGVSSNELQVCDIASLLIDVKILRVPVAVRFDSAETIDSAIATLVKAREAVWGPKGG